MTREQEIREIVEQYSCGEENLDNKTVKAIWDNWKARFAAIGYDKRDFLSILDELIPYGHAYAVLTVPDNTGLSVFLPVYELFYDEEEIEPIYGIMVDINPAELLHELKRITQD